MNNFHFDAITVFPSLQMGDKGSLLKNIQPRTFFNKNGKRTDSWLVRARWKNEKWVMMGWHNYFTSYIHLSPWWTLLYESSLEPSFWYEISVANKVVLVSLLHEFSTLLGSLLNKTSIHSVENEFRTIFELALRSWMKVYREISERGRPFIFEDLSFYDSDNMPLQVDDLGTDTMPKVGGYFDKKIRYETELNVQKRYQRFIRRFWEETIELFIQQTWTLWAELYHLWKNQLPILNSEIILHKN